MDEKPIQKSRKIKKQANNNLEILRENTINLEFYI